MKKFFANIFGNKPPKKNSPKGSWKPTLKAKSEAGKTYVLGKDASEYAYQYQMRNTPMSASTITGMNIIDTITDTILGKSSLLTCEFDNSLHIVHNILSQLPK